MRLKDVTDNKTSVSMPFAANSKSSIQDLKSWNKEMHKMAKGWKIPLMLLSKRTCEAIFSATGM